MITSLLTAFTMGLLGAGHCLGMCGGVAAAISFTTPKEKSKFPYLLCYNLGRLLSYALIGALAGGMIAIVSEFKQSLIWLRLLSAILMILLGLYIGQFYNGLAFMERIGQSLWQHISPTAQKLLPLKSAYWAIPFGFIWGWIPCGMVYSALSWAAVSGSLHQGSLIMLAFGLGTLPAMLLVGSAGESFKKVLKNFWFRRISALILIAYGLLSLLMIFTKH